MNGVIVIDKPSGPTSRDIVEEVRRALGSRKAGHTGTLDPLATGVLPVCINEATKLVQFLALETRSTGRPYGWGSGPTLSTPTAVSSRGRSLP